MVVPTVKLNNGCTIPIVGLGTWKVDKHKIEINVICQLSNILILFVHVQMENSQSLERSNKQLWMLSLLDIGTLTVLSLMAMKKKLGLESNKRLMMAPSPEMICSLQARS